jgi:hypothetical protein
MSSDKAVRTGGALSAMAHLTAVREWLGILCLRCAIYPINHLSENVVGMESVAALSQCTGWE